MKILTGLLFLSLLSSARPVYAQAGQCSIASAQAVAADTLESSFRTTFCGKNKARCDALWSNGKTLIGKLLSDKRIENIGIAAYMFATAWVETASGELSPATVEIKFPGNENRPYWKKAPNGQVYFGRGWSQITWGDRYKVASKVLGTDFYANPDETLTADNSYEILYVGMRDGWFEVFRNTAMGGADNKPLTPARIGEFITNDKYDYDHARAVINANCPKTGGRCSPKDIEYKPGLFIPDAPYLDAGPAAASVARKFETIVCQAAKKL